MESMNGTGITYPEIELGGKKYVVKFTRGLIYRMGKAGIDFRPVVTQGSITVPFSTLVDVLHMAITFEGTPEDLAEVLYDKRNEAMTALIGAWAKMLPPVRLAPEPGAKLTGEQVQ